MRRCLRSDRSTSRYSFDNWFLQLSVSRYVFFDTPCILTGNKRVAVKVQKLTPESQSLIIEEYKILRDFASHPNLPDFYGIYRRRSGKKTEYDQIWFVMEVRFARGFVSKLRHYRIRRKCYLPETFISRLNIDPKIYPVTPLL